MTQMKNSKATTKGFHWGAPHFSASFAVIDAAGKEEIITPQDAAHAIMARAGFNFNGVRSGTPDGTLGRHVDDHRVPRWPRIEGQRVRLQRPRPADSARSATACTIPSVGSLSMQSIECTRRWVRYASALCLLSCLVLSAHAADGVNLEGTWKIVAPRTSFKPEGGAIPFTTEGKKRYAENRRFRAQKQFGDYDYTTSRCSAPGTPRIMLTSERLQILQQPDMIMMAFEWNRVRRLIALPELPPQQSLFGGLGEAPTEDLVGTMMGTSKGHWEGDILVVTTGKFSDRTLIDELVPHGYDMKVTERIRLKDTDTLEDHITIEDPEFFTRDWETVLTYKRQPDAVIPEDVCLDRLLGPPLLVAK
jgi:hypothetical protein